MIDRVAIPTNHFETAQQWIRTASIDWPRARQGHILKRTVIGAGHVRTEITGLNDPIATDQSLYVQVPGVRKLRTIFVIEPRSSDGPVVRGQQNVLCC